MRPPAPPAWFFGCLVAMEGLDLLVPGPRLLTSPWTFLGALPVGVGMVLHGWATRVFRRAGPYARSRKREEGALQVRFSGEWDTYRGTVRRWI